MDLIKRVIDAYWRFLVSPERYARHLGVTIGEGCFISTREWSTEPYLITIGNHVQVTRNVVFNTHGGGHVVRNRYPDFDVFGKITVGDWVYIGAYSQIMPGVTIGEGALVAGGSVVTKSVDPHTVVGGNPARYICTTEEYYQRNKQYDIGTAKVSNLSLKKEILLSTSEDRFIKK